jgi:hypothetical protein
MCLLEITNLRLCCRSEDPVRTNGHFGLNLADQVACIARRPDAPTCQTI